MALGCGAQWHARHATGDGVRVSETDARRDAPPRQRRRSRFLHRRQVQRDPLRAERELHHLRRHEAGQRPVDPVERRDRPRAHAPRSAKLMELLVGSFFFGILLPLIAIVVAALAFRLVRRRPASRRTEVARIAALEAEVRGLLARVRILEQHALRAMSRTSEPPRAVGLDQPPPAPPEPVPPAEREPVVASAEPAPLAMATLPAIDLEQRIGARWSTWVGVIAILFAIGFFLKWSFENDLLGPGTRVLLGLVSGVGLLLSGLLLHRRRDVPYASAGLTGLGLGILYLALFGAHALYGLLAARSAFAAMFGVTLLGAVVAVVSSRQVTAVLAVLGGLLTPLLLTVAEPDERDLLAYLLVLDLLVLAVARFRTWPALNRLAWTGTALLFAASLSREPDSPNPLSRLALASALFGLFVAVPLLQPLKERRRGEEIDLLIVVANAAGYFWVVYVTLEAWQPRAEAWFALALALVYRFVATDYAARVPYDEATVVVHEGIAWAFLTLAVPLAVSDQWVTLAWAVEGVLLLAVAARLATPVSVWGGAAALALAAVRVVGVDQVGAGAPPVWNVTYALHVFVVLALGVGGALAPRARSDRLRWFTGPRLRTLLWLTAALVLSVLLWREPPGLWAASLLTAELLVVGWLARATRATAWMIATPMLALVVLERVLSADDERARNAAESLLNAPFASRIAACLAIALCGGWVSRSSSGAGGRAIGRALSGVAGLALLFVLSVNWTRYQGEGQGWTTQVGLSVLWVLYAAAVLTWGFLRSSPPVRYAALALLGFTVLKVFYVDLSAVQTAYRIVSFLVLGVVLLSVSLLYQKGRRVPG
ncbi:MAG: hypothetical protein C5B48_03875 [Candidatus Rokuibacteriota bacterium]|nr:MAG: hypothetical protein C5B48_03875 [Candidatus Rokubacteria bacterium]